MKGKKEIFTRGHPELNQGPLDLQSNALPLSYTPLHSLIGELILYVRRPDTL